jgi:hypothetical protein
MEDRGSRIEDGDIISILYLPASIFDLEKPPLDSTLEHVSLGERISRKKGSFNMS